LVFFAPGPPLCRAGGGQVKIVVTWFLWGSLIFLVFLALAMWIHNLRHQILYLRSLNRQAQKEQEAVLSLMDKLGERITSKIDLDDTLKILTEYIVQATNAESGAIFVHENESLRARVKIGPFPPLQVVAAPDAEGSADADEIRIGEGIVGLVAERGEPLLVSDAEADPRVPRHPTLLNEAHSLILCPLRVRGSILGVFVVVNKLGGAVFDLRDMALLQALADQAAVTVDLVKLYDVLADQQRLEQELAVAHEFQRMLLPDVFPRLPGFELYAMSEAALIIGGDYFDFFEVDDAHLGLVIADVSGKGIPGALIMAMVRAVLRAESRGILSPKDVLRRVNERIVADTKENVFTTMTYGILDLRTGRLKFVRAGHEPLLILGREEKQVTQLTPRGLALGLAGGEIFDHNEEAEVQLHPGEVVLLYTDGVIEAMDQSSKEYGRERLIARLKASDNPTAESLIRSVVEDLHQFTLGIPQHDDITLLALRMLPAGPSEPREGAGVAQGTA